MDARSVLESEILEAVVRGPRYALQVFRRAHVDFWRKYGDGTAHKDTLGKQAYSRGEGLVTRGMYCAYMRNYLEKEGYPVHFDKREQDEVEGYVGELNGEFVACVVVANEWCQVCVENLATTLEHELVHVAQFTRGQAHAGAPKFRDVTDRMAGSSLGIQHGTDSMLSTGYYGNPHEIMAYAVTCVSELSRVLPGQTVAEQVRLASDFCRAGGVDGGRVGRKIRDSEFGQVYRALHGKPEWKRFLKYVYQARQMADADAEETGASSSSPSASANTRRGARRV